jgi:hypothetical protein
LLHTESSTAILSSTVIQYIFSAAGFPPIHTTLNIHDSGSNPFTFFLYAFVVNHSVHCPVVTVSKFVFFQKFDNQLYFASLTLAAIEPHSSFVIILSKILSLDLS